MTFTQLLEQPGSVDFYQAVYFLQRQLSAQEQQWYSVGRDAFPGQELIRFKSVQHMGFPGQPISKIEATDSSYPDKSSHDIHVSFMGLTGPSGVLPQHYSELMLQRLKQRDRSMRDFFDLFNHRLISLYYRAWEKYRFPCQYENQADSQDSFSQVLTKLVGTQASMGSYYAGAFATANRGAQHLQQMLTELLGAKVSIIPLQGRWLTLNDEECSSLASRLQPEGVNAELGRSAMLGRRVWDIGSAIDVRIEAESEVLSRLMPGESLYELVKGLLSRYLDPVIRTRISLSGRYTDFARVQLGSGRNRLGQIGRLSIRSHRLESASQVSFKLARS
ncbi:type VI secretion system baseplate subunit TssG [Shewanella sp. AS16]|uniref:type VI secretion system baseplate subunit TssG n=1 Tax=Shewanella sp. AS16 TaxID=2907625 RepID=UPI001F2E6BCD|nr:type VI secretion system baseplate subunit TssG [Shewanella sp. AS16]MCE9687204.1 type VI secretion system baseplate subunit TssG [Shewanella sp. AS16]